MPWDNLLGELVAVLVPHARPGPRHPGWPARLKPHAKRASPGWGTRRSGATGETIYVEEWVAAGPPESETNMDTANTAANVPDLSGLLVEGLVAVAAAVTKNKPAAQQAMGAKLATVVGKAGWHAIVAYGLPALEKKSPHVAELVEEGLVLVATFLPAVPAPAGAPTTDPAALADGTARVS